MASGPCAAPTGRRHGRTDQPSHRSEINLANGEPSRHGAKLMAAFGACGGGIGILSPLCPPVAALPALHPQPSFTRSVAWLRAKDGTRRIVAARDGAAGGTIADDWSGGESRSR
jgi:hypothetical protein